MKFLAVITVFALVAVACAEDALKLNDEQKEKVHNAAAECIKESETTKEKVQALRTGDFSDVDDKTKCFAKCFQGKFGLFVNGAVQSEAVLKSLGPLAGEDKVKAIGAKCDGIKGSDECDTAFQVYKCYYTEKATYL